MTETAPSTTAVANAKAALHSALKASRWKPGEKLPAERTLSEELGVNRMSLRQALLALEHEGEIFRIDRRGWFVAQQRFVYDPLTHVSFAQSGGAQGEVSWSDLDTGTEQASTQDAADFGIEEGAPLHRLRGWGAFNGHRVFVHDVLINGAFAPDFLDTFDHGSVTGHWTRTYGIDPILGDVLIRPVRLEGDPQHILGCSSGAPGLYIRRKKLDPNGRVIQIDREFWRNQAIEIRFTGGRN